MVAGETIAVAFPAGFRIPWTIAPKSVYLTENRADGRNIFSDYHPDYISVSKLDNTVSMTWSEGMLGPDTNFVITFAQCVGIMSPQTPGDDYTVTIGLGKNGTVISNPFSIQLR